MSERERGNNVITWSIVLVIFGFFCIYISSNSRTPEFYGTIGGIAIVGGILFIVWGSVLRGPLSERISKRSFYNQQSEKSSFSYHLIIGILASIIGGLVIHALISQ